MPGALDPGLPTPDGARLATGALFAKTGRSPKKAAAFYRVACERGDAAGCTGLAGLLANGLGVPRDDRVAGTLYQQACSRDDASACANLGVLVLDGRYPGTRDAALVLLQRGCKAGSSVECRRLKTESAKQRR